MTGITVTRRPAIYWREKVTVTPENAEAVDFGAGDLVVFPKGMKCVWDIKEDVRKHYSFG